MQIADLKLYDFFAMHLSRQIPPHDPKVVVVDIDEQSLQAMGQWPWPRILLADLTKKITRSHASVIAFDMIFAENDRTSPIEIKKFYERFFRIDVPLEGIPPILRDNDGIFRSVLLQSDAVGGVYLTQNASMSQQCVESAFFDTVEVGNLRLRRYDALLCNTPRLQTAFTKIGFVNSYKDPDGILRRMPLFQRYKNHTVPALPIAILSVLDSKIRQISPQTYTILGKRIECDASGNVLLRFYADGWYKKISAADILRGRFSKRNLEGKIVVIGSSAIGLHDRVTVSGFREMTGAHVHVTMLQNILDQSYFIQPQAYRYSNVLVSMAAAFLLFYFLVRKRNFSIVTLFILGILGSTALAYIVFLSGTYVSIGYFLIPFVFHFFFVSFAYILIEAYQRYLFNVRLSKTQTALLDSMVYVAEIHDTETGAHIVRTKLYVKVLAEYLYSHGFYKNELSEKKIDIMYTTAPLHDIGKIGIPDSVLKKPGKLTAEEFEEIKKHPVIGGRIIDNAIASYEQNEFFRCARNIALYHHEKWDGKGYPYGLKGEDIPLESRLMAIADVFDALISRRVYKESFPYEKIRQIIIEGKGTHFDPVLVDAFLAIEYKFQEIAARYSDENETNTKDKS